MGKYTKMSQQVLEKVGGLSNITFVERCATRLRIHYASKSKVDVEAIKGIENVVGVVAKTGQVQIIIGPEVNDAFNDFLEVSGWRPTDDRPTVVEEEPEKKGFMYWVNKFGNFSAAVFMPIVPALITGGLILAIKNLMVNYLGMGVDSGTAKVCLAIFSAGFSMLPVWIGYTMANKLKMEPIMGAFLGAVLVSSSISGVEGLDPHSCSGVYFQRDAHCYGYHPDVLGGQAAQEDHPRNGALLLKAAAHHADRRSHHPDRPWPDRH